MVGLSVESNREYASVFPAAADWARSPVPDLTNRLSRLAIPVLLIWATHDAISPLPVARALAAKICSSSILTFPSSDHWVVHRFANESAAAIRAFVGACSSDPPRPTERLVDLSCDPAVRNRS